jgi:hypothetical protein
MGLPETHLYRMQLETRWAEEELKRPAPPERDAPAAAVPARHRLAGLFGIFGRFAKQRVLAPVR